MNSNMPTIEILLAVYRPNPAFFRPLLRSLDAQDYPALGILMLDDSGDEAFHAPIADMAAACLTAHPYRLLRNETNLGVRRTFARLTGEATGDYVAYADQDDLWLPQKLSRLAALLRQEGSELAYCNLAIIDGQGKTQYPTLQAMNPRLLHRHGAGLFPYFLQSNCIPGCTMLVVAGAAKAALPFPAPFLHDQWLALWAASRGSIAYDPAPLIQYRLHGGNVVGMQPLAGVTDRLTYVSERLRPQLAMLEAAKARFTAPVHQAEIARQERALQKRIAYLEKRRLYHLPALIAGQWRDPLRWGLEALLGVSPQGIGETLIAFAKGK